MIALLQPALPGWCCRAGAAVLGREHWFFDLDGTLIDSERCHDQAFRAVIELAVPELLPGFRYQEHRGKRTIEVFRELGVHDTALAEKLTQSKQARYRQHIERGEVPLLEGAAALLAWLRGQGHRLCLVTGSSRQSARRILQAHGLEACFEHLVCAEDVSQGKPAPDGYLRALALSKAASRNALAVEDAAAGVRAAHGAGIAALQVHRAETTEADLEFPDFRSLLACLRAGAPARRVGA